MATDDTSSTGTESNSTDDNKPAQTVQPPVQHANPVDLKPLMDTLNALPELISRSVAEAVKPARQAPVKTEETKKETTETKTVEKPTAQTEHPGKWRWNGGKGWFA